MYLAGVNTFTIFKLIDIIGGIDPYPTLLATEYNYENYGVIDMKKGTRTFKVYGMNVTQHIDFLYEPR